MTRPINEITGIIVDSALKIHRRFGPGLLESVCQKLLARELERRGLRVDVNRMISFEFDGLRFERALTIDLLVEDSVVVEVKSVEKMAPVHFKQVLTYLRVTGLTVGLLINFGLARLKDGIERVANNYGEATSHESEIDESSAEQPYPD